MGELCFLFYVQVHRRIEKVPSEPDQRLRSYSGNGPSLQFLSVL